MILRIVTDVIAVVICIAGVPGSKVGESIMINSGIVVNNILVFIIHVSIAKI